MCFLTYYLKILQECRTRKSSTIYKAYFWNKIWSSFFPAARYKHGNIWKALEMTAFGRPELRLQSEAQKDLRE